MNEVLAIQPAVVAVTAASLMPFTAGFSAAEVTRRVEQAPASGRTVRVDIYEKKQGDPAAPVVVVLHGVGGMLGDGPLMRRAAASLARAGFRACVPHYFNATGTFFTTPARAQEHGPTWKAAIEEILAHFAALAPTGDVNVFGYSMGGFLAAGAVREGAPIRALAVLSSGVLTAQQEAKLEAFPPLLVLHGGKDTKVTPEQADALVRLAASAGARVSDVRYPREGHGFSPSAERDAFDRTAAFFLAESQ